MTVVRNICVSSGKHANVSYYPVAAEKQILLYTIKLSLQLCLVRHLGGRDYGFLLNNLVCGLSNNICLNTETSFKKFNGW